MLRILVIALSLLAGCPNKPVKAPRTDAPFKPGATDHVRLVFIGDTGAANEAMRALRAAVIKERKDAVVVLGDLVYPMMPECPTGQLEAEALQEMNTKVGDMLRGLGAPVLVTLGNHDTEWGKENNPLKTCVELYAAREPDIVFPAENYLVDYGVALLAFVNTNRLTAGNGHMVREAFAEHRGWKIGVGHHVLKTYRDKVGETIVARWLKRQRIRPDLWTNGHAHLLQYGVYDGIPAITSGTGAYPRKRKTCPPECGAGEMFGESKVGYAVVDITAKRMGITFKDTNGKVMFRTQVTR